MTRLIDADAVYKILESCEIRKATIGNPLTDWEYGYTCGIERAESEIDCAPTLDAVPVRHGKWLPENRTMDAYWVCSCCGFPSEAHGAFKIYKYCPNCGARMDGNET